MINSPNPYIIFVYQLINDFNFKNDIIGFFKINDFNFNNDIIGFFKSI